VVATWLPMDAGTANACSHGLAQRRILPVLDLLEAEQVDLPVGGQLFQIGQHLRLAEGFEHAVVGDVEQRLQAGLPSRQPGSSRCRYSSAILSTEKSCARAFRAAWSWVDCREACMAAARASTSPTGTKVPYLPSCRISR